MVPQRCPFCQVPTLSKMVTPQIARVTGLSRSTLIAWLKKKP